MWIPLILGSAFFLALYDLAKKESVRENEVLRVLFWATLAGSSAFIAYVAATGHLAEVVHPDARAFGLTIVKTLIVSSSWVFTYYALRGLPITIATPIRASAPAWVFMGAACLYGEIPNWIQAAGMLLTFAGYFAFSVAGKFEGIDFFRNRHVWLAVCGMFLSAASGLWDKFILQKVGVPRLTMQFWFQIDLVVVYGMMLIVQRIVGIQRTKFQWRWTIPLVGILLAVADWLYFAGIAVPDVPISVASLMRRVSVVITFVLGAKFFRETNLRRKGIALAMIVLGVALLCVK